MSYDRMAAGYSPAAGNSPKHSAGEYLRARPNFRFPISQSKIPYGVEVANCIDAVRSYYSLDIFRSSVVDLDEIVRRLRKDSCEPYGTYLHTHVRHHPLQDVIGQSYVYAAMLRLHGDIHAIDALRATALAASLNHPYPRGAKTAVHTLAQCLITPNKRRYEPCAIDVHHILSATKISQSDLAQALSQILAEPDTPATGIRRANTLARLVAPGTTTTTRIARSPVTLLDRDGCRFNQFPEWPPDEELRPGKGIPLEDLVDSDEWHAAPLVDRGDDLLPSLDQLPLIAVGDGITQPIAEFIAREHTRHRLAGDLLPDTDRVLTFPDARALYLYITDGINAAPFQSVELDRLFAYLTLGLMLITGRSMDESGLAIKQYLDGKPSSDDKLTISEKHWHGRYPIAYPQKPQGTKTWFVKTYKRPRFPLPTELIIGIHLLASEQSRIDPEHFNKDFVHEIIRSLRTILPGLSLQRCSNTLPVALYLETGHHRDWQIICGNDAFRSSAPAHYYAPPAHQLVDTYVSGLERLGITCPCGKIPSERYGAPRAAINPKPINTAVLALVRSMPGESRSGVNILRWVEDLNDLAVYTALLFSVCVAHRFTKAIGKVSLRDFAITPDSGRAHESKPPLSVARVSDKCTHEAAVTRICVIPPILATQIGVLQAHQTRLLARLTKANDPRGLIQAKLRDADQGSGPIWFLIDLDKAECADINHCAIAGRWPEMKLPLPYLRHYFATYASIYDLRGCDVAQQMGHDLDEPPHGVSDPESPFEFAARCAGSIESYARAMGFEVRGEIERRNCKLRAVVSESADLLLKMDRVDRAAIQRLNKQQPVISELERANAVSAVDAWLNKTERDDPYCRSPSAIDDWLGEYTQHHPTVAEQLVVRESLQSKLDALTEEYGLEKRLLVPPITKRKLPLAPIRSPHLCAHNWACDLETFCKAGLEHALENDNHNAATAHGVLLLALWGCGSHVIHLAALMSTRSRLSTSAEMGGCAVAERPNDDSISGALSAQVIPEALVPLLSYLRTRLTGRFDAKTISRLIAQESTLATKIGGAPHEYLDTALAAISLARRMTASGPRAAWESDSLASVGPSPERFFAALWNTATEQPPPGTMPAKMHDKKTLAAKTTGHEIYRGLRSSLYGVTKHQNSSTNRAELNERLESIRSIYTRTTFIRVLADCITHAVAVDGHTHKTAYQYLTTLTPLCEKLTEVDFQYVDTELLVDHARRLAIHRHTTGRKTSTSSLASALSWLANGFDRVDVAFEYSAALESVAMPELRSPGFLWSQAEQDAVLTQLAHWRHSAYSDPSRYGDAHAFAASQLGAIIQLKGALRIGELTALRVSDLRIHPNGIGCNIRQRPSHSLKSPASARHSWIAMPQKERQCISRLRSTLDDRRTDRGDELLAWKYRMHRTSISAQYSRILGHAMRRILPRECARTHAGRHNHASLAGYAVQPYRFKPFSLHIAGSHQQTLETLDRLPRRVAYRHLSRQMGHAGSDTTLVWYDHTASLMTDCARFWEGPSRSIEWRLATSRMAMSLSAWSRAVQRFQSYNRVDQLGRTSAPPWAKLIEHDLHTKPNAAPPGPVDIPDDLIPSHAGLLLSFAHVALRGRTSEAAVYIDNSKAIQELANEVGVSKDAAATLLSELKHHEAHLGTKYLVSTRNRPSALPRIARAHIFMPVLRRLQEQLEGKMMRASDLSDWVRRNRGAAGRPGELVFEWCDTHLLDAFKAKLPADRFSSRDHAIRMYVRPHERQFLCLVLYAYAQFAAESNTHPPSRRRIEQTHESAPGSEA